MLVDPDGGKGALHVSVLYTRHVKEARGLMEMS